MVVLNRVALHGNTLPPSDFFSTSCFYDNIKFLLKNSFDTGVSMLSQEENHILNLMVNDSTNGFSHGEPGGM